MNFRTKPQNSFGMKNVIKTLDHLRKKVQKSPAFNSPDFEKPYIIQADASKGVLPTFSPKKWIKFGRKVLSKIKFNYDTIIEELLAIYFCVK